MVEVTYNIRNDITEAECKAALVAAAKDMVDAIIASCVREKYPKAAIEAVTSARVGLEDFNVVVEFRNGGDDTHISVKVGPEH